MKLTKNTIKLICELEYLVGDTCYNPNSFDGWTLEEGRAYRYPVTYTNKEGEERKCWSVLSDMDKNRINTMRYKFGSNNLFIGRGIVTILVHLEQKYGIDFSELVKQKK